jgi:hypothetical protein
MSGKKQETGRKHLSLSCMSAVFVNAEETPMKGSTLSRAVFAIAFLITASQLRASPLSPPSGSYELIARLELAHLERWGVDKNHDHLSVQLAGAGRDSSAGGDRE